VYPTPQRQIPAEVLRGIVSLCGRCKDCQAIDTVCRRVYARLMQILVVDSCEHSNPKLTTLNLSDGQQLLLDSTTTAKETEAGVTSSRSRGGGKLTQRSSAPSASGTSGRCVVLLTAANSREILFSSVVFKGL